MIERTVTVLTTEHFNLPDGSTLPDDILSKVQEDLLGGLEQQATVTIENPLGHEGTYLWDDGVWVDEDGRRFEL
jgi:hypothetical protein